MGDHDVLWLASGLVAVMTGRLPLNQEAPWPLTDHGTVTQ